MPDRLRRYLQPREGWLAAVLLLVMLLTVGWSVQHVGWLDQADFLVPVAFYGLLLGALLGLSSLSVVAVLPASAILGSAIVLWTVGGEYFTDLSQGDRLAQLRGEAIDWIQILTDRGFAPQLTPYALGLGVIMWVTAFMAAYTLYRHHRVVDAILLVGAALLVNMSATLTDLFRYLIIFMLAALLLWLRAALVGREEGWQRRRVNENAEVPGAIMRSGLVFIVGSIVMAFVLTSVAVAAPLTAVWNNLDTVWSGVRDELNVIFGGLNNGDSRFHGTSFGPDFSISGEWTSSDDPVLTVAADKALYLRAVTYDVYTGHGWAQSPGGERRVESDQLIFPAYTPEKPSDGDAFDVATIEIQIQRTSGRTLFTTGYPISATAPVVVLESGDKPFLGSLQATTSIPSGSSYGLRAAMSKATKAQLRSAATAYPAEIEQFYLGTDGLTQRTRDLARQIVQEAEGDTPYDRAQALTDYFQGSEFAYRIVAPVSDDPNRDFVDFFLFDPDHGKVGYCEHYATAMVALARSVGIPARVAVGYAPGQRVDVPGGEHVPSSPVWQVRERNAHAWAELYFPGYGWQIFEATKTIPQIVRITGSVTPSASPGGPGSSARPSFDVERRTGENFSLPSSQPIPGGHRPGEDRPLVDGRIGNVVVISGLIGLLLLVAAWRWRRVRRALRFMPPGDRQWRRLALAGDRAGVAQRPSETIYEYAGWLEEQLP
ncbi:MAG TPA: transglutaminaseTgpA domain-containing protein, partial [Candidatus Limnocylindrales bacterium]|nr:transglutaminaseTgpA domain-containing protein [Candidatus Limnocylindrales bacterium]